MTSATRELMVFKSCARNKHGAEQIIGANQSEFLLFRQIAEVEKTEVVISDENARGGGVFAGVVGRRRLGCAKRIRLSGSRQRRGRMVSGSSNDLNVDSFER